MITQQDLIDRFGEVELAELSDHDQHADINAVVVAKAIADAQSEAMSYLAAAGIAKAVQLSPPSALKIKLCDIARYYLYENGMIEVVETRYNRAIVWLKDVMRNPSMLVDADNTDKATSDAMSGSMVKPNPLPRGITDGDVL